MPAALTQLKEVWGRLKPGQRVAVVAAALATLGLVGAVVFYGTRAEYGVLFSDLRPADAQAVVEKLKTEGVPYQLSGGGTAVSVPAERVAELRLQVASAGIIAGGHVGFDLFDKGSFGTTDFAQQINYQRAIEGELARTLESMEELESVRVHVTRPKESLFTDKAERAKASVMAKVRAGRELSRERTEAVVSLVASAVEGLDPADVSVIDTRGRLLSSPSRGQAGDLGVFNQQLEARRRFEAETAARVVALLEPISGAGHVRADVSADLDFSQVEQTEEKYDPKSQVVRSQQTAQEVRNGAQAGPGGVVGARANDPTAPVAAAPQPAAAAQTGDQRASTTTNYEIDKTVRRTVAGGGRLTRLSVSVAVDYKAAEGGQSVARTPEELEKIQGLVAAAVGIDAQRGDQVVIQTMPFDRAPADDAAAMPWAERNRDLVKMALKYGALLLVALLVLLFVVRPARKALRAAAPPRPAFALPAAEVEGGPAPVEEVLKQLDGAAAAGGALAPGVSAQEQAGMKGPRTVAEMEAEMEERIARELGVPEVKRAAAVKKHIIDRSENDAELIAMTLRGWLQESR